MSDEASQSLGLAFAAVLGPVATGGPGDVWPPSPTIDLTFPLDHLATTMAQAGIANENGGNGKKASPSARMARADTATALDQLRETLDRAGIWREG